ncbi:hypothetical protein [Candidatus Stoquefichus massiliensis]|uniref:hypothetical protein n=1 Tax=Candidatus Stoquefichus massiliensis TaxID=1470350 RepID=UPI0004AD757A|nr:hypothetical protein [Candidatus Stoquefichus massiliensis]
MKVDANIKVSIINEYNELEYLSEVLGVKTIKIVGGENEMTSKRISQKTYAYTQ